MNAFTQELHKILACSSLEHDVSYAGRVAYIRLDSDLRAKLEFISLHVFNQYDALKLTVLNRTEGAVDTNVLRFSELFGKKRVSNPNFLDGVVPHLWDNNGDVRWYVYQPTQADHRRLAAAVDEYLQVFQVQQTELLDMGQKIY